MYRQSIVAMCCCALALGAVWANPASSLRELRKQTQQVAKSRNVLAKAVVEAALSSDAQLQDDTARQLVRIDSQVKDLVNQIDNFRATLDRGGREAEQIGDELNRLRQQLQVERVSLALLQTELFPSGSEDQIAAAAVAVRAASDAINRIPAGAPARLAMRRLKVDALIRSDRLDEAATELESLIALTQKPLPPPLRALQIRLDLRTGDVKRAAQRLSEYDQRNSASVPVSLAMDFARLEYLAIAEEAALADWLDEIESRHGSLARRRAERIVMAKLADMQNVRSIAPALLAAEGRGALRRGNHHQSGELLAKAAALETDADRALRYAVEAAAARRATGANSSAANVLIEAAVSHAETDQASELHLQAIYLLAPTTPERIDSLLRDHLERWPDRQTASISRRWIEKRLAQQGQLAAAAEAASAIPANQVGDADVQHIFAAWQRAFIAAPQDVVAEVARRFRAATEPLVDNASWRAHYRQIGALMLHRDALAGLPAAGNQPNPFIEALIRLRRWSEVTDGLHEPPQELIPIATWRLMQDGRVYPQSRATIISVIDRWAETDSTSLNAAERMLWLGDHESAIRTLHAFISQSEHRVSSVAKAAQLLSESEAVQAQQESIRLWDYLSGHSPAGGELWYQAKLSAIRVLQEMGRHDQAERRARYMLLTHPDLDEAKQRELRTIAP